MSDDQREVVKALHGRLQFPLWLLFAATAFVALILSLLVTGGVRAVTIALGTGAILGVFTAGFFVERLRRQSWPIVAGAVLGSVFALLVGLASGAICREHLVFREHAKFDHPEVKTAHKLAAIGGVAGIVIGLAAGWTLDLRIRRREGSSDATTLGRESTRRSRLGRVFGVMGLLALALAVILLCAAHPEANAVLILGAVLVSLSLVFWGVGHW